MNETYNIIHFLISSVICVECAISWYLTEF